MNIAKRLIAGLLISVSAVTLAVAQVVYGVGTITNIESQVVRYPFGTGSQLRFIVTIDGKKPRQVFWTEQTTPACMQKLMNARPGDHITVTYTNGVFDCEITQGGAGADA